MNAEITLKRGGVCVSDEVGRVMNTICVDIKENVSFNFSGGEEEMKTCSIWILL